MIRVHNVCLVGRGFEPTVDNSRMIVLKVKENLNHRQEDAASHQPWTGHYSASSIYILSVNEKLPVSKFRYFGKYIIQLFGYCTFMFLGNDMIV